MTEDVMLARLYCSIASLKRVILRGGCYAVWSFTPEWRGVWGCTGAGRAGVPGGGGRMEWGVCRGLYCAPERRGGTDLRSLDSAGSDGCWYEAHPVGYIGDAAIPATTVEGGPRGGGPGSIVERALYSWCRLRRWR